MYKTKNQYYCLVASLPELRIDTPSGSVDFAELRSQITEAISPDDAKTLATLYGFYDVSNLVNTIMGNDMPHNKLGTLSKEQIQNEIEAPEIDDIPFQSLLDQSIAAILDRYKQRAEDSDDLEPVNQEQLENQLWNSFYNAAAKSISPFVRTWCNTDRSLRNIIAAQKARTFGIDPAGVIVGYGPIEEQIKTSAAADFGLRGDFDYYEQLAAVIDTNDMIEREHKMDALRWRITSELTDQNYFDIDFLAAYLVKLNIIERWTALDKTVGAQRFKAIVDSFTADVKL